MRNVLAFPLVLLAAAATVPALASDPVPEITRGQVAPQAIGAAHTVRTIPEACARFEGAFTGEADEPYRFSVVRTSPNCQPRARFVDAAKAQPSLAAGWKFNDLIRIPNAGCPTQFAVVRVWRRPTDAAAQETDGQGQARIYLEDQRRNAAANKLAAVPLFAAAMRLEGLPCAK